MRLWTIQNKSILKAIEKGVWYSNFGYRSKDVDLDNDLLLRGRYPIYAYAMMSQDYLNINTMRIVLRQILQQQRLPRDWDDVLVELEVAEEDIVHIKPLDSNDYNSGFHFVCDYKNSINELVISHKKGESSYVMPKDLEAVLHKVKSSQIVAAHEFSVDTINDVITLKNIYNNPAVGASMISRYVSMTTDGSFRIDRNKDSDLAQIKNSYKDINTLVKAKCGALKASPDMTVYEAINFVKDDVTLELLDAFDEYEAKNPEADILTTFVRDIMPE